MARLRWATGARCALRRSHAWWAACASWASGARRAVAAFGAARGWVALGPETAVPSACCPWQTSGACCAPRGWATYASRPGAASRGDGMP
jgi:hypothetical protein